MAKQTLPKYAILTIGERNYALIEQSITGPERYNFLATFRSEFQAGQVRDMLNGKEAQCPSR